MTLSPFGEIEDKKVMQAQAKKNFAWKVVETKVKGKRYNKQRQIQAKNSKAT